MAPRLDFIGIVVSDMARALAFYRALGLPIPEGAESEDHVEITLPSGLRLGWDTEELVRSLDPGWTQPKGNRIGLAFECGSPSGVNETYGKLTDLGYIGLKAPWDAFWGQRYAQIADPDGTTLDLFASLEE